MLRLLGACVLAALPVAWIATPAPSPTPSAPPGPAASSGPSPSPAGIAPPGSAAPAPLLGDTAPDSVAEWRFPPGEKMNYSVKFAGLRLGTAFLAVEAVDTLRSYPVYRIAMETSGGPPFYRIHDRQISWVRPRPLASVRFEQRLRQGSYRRDRRYELDPSARVYTRYDLREGEFVPFPEETAQPTPEGALDDISFLYLTRLLPLEVGQRYELERHFRARSNPVILEVLRREEIRVPAGRFRTLVVRPIIRASGLFGEDGKAEVFLSDDERRLIVRLKFSMKVGGGEMYLNSWEPGDPSRLIPPPALAQDTAPPPRPSVPESESEPAGGAEEGR